MDLAAGWKKKILLFFSGSTYAAHFGNSNRSGAAATVLQCFLSTASIYLPFSKVITSQLLLYTSWRNVGWFLLLLLYAFFFVFWFKFCWFNVSSLLFSGGPVAQLLDFSFRLAYKPVRMFWKRNVELIFNSVLRVEIFYFSIASVSWNQFPIPSRDSTIANESVCFLQFVC